jgi:hypothetical protein
LQAEGSITEAARQSAKRSEPVPQSPDSAFLG